jgi:hypothetical protein
MDPLKQIFNILGLNGHMFRRNFADPVEKGPQPAYEIIIAVDSGILIILNDFEQI